MAFFRALESRRPAAERLFVDSVAEAFLDRPLRAAVVAAALPGVGRVVPWLLDRRIPGPRASAVARTRYIDDALGAAVAAGTEQVVILGAGYDSRAYRLPELRRVRVFEIDHPDTQSVKRHVLEQQFGALPPHVAFVAVDFDREPLAPAVAKAELRPGRRTFTIWEGVASYLTPEAVDTTVRWTSDVAGPGSELVFTYVHRELITRTRHFPHADAWVRSVERAGEPFVFGFTPDDLVQYLGVRGWKLVRDLATPEALALYGLSVARVPSFYRIAHAIRCQQPS
jgi:methyltransferase (TIGR00027 family)